MHRLTSPTLSRHRRGPVWDFFLTEDLRGPTPSDADAGVFIMVNVEAVLVNYYITYGNATASAEGSGVASHVRPLLSIVSFVLL